MKKLFAFCSLFVIIGQTGYSQILYHDIIPDTTIGSGSVNTCFNLHPPAAPAEFSICRYPDLRVLIEINGPPGSGEILMSTGFPAKLESGNNIGPSGTWSALNTSSEHVLSADGNGNWRSNAQDKYLGFRFKNTTGVWLYGWLKMSIADDASAFTVKEWAYGSAGANINAGDKPTTGISITGNTAPVKLILEDKKIHFSHLINGRRFYFIATDMSGRQVIKKDFNSGETITVNGFAPGIYLIHLYNNEDHYRFKISIP